MAIWREFNFGHEAKTAGASSGCIFTVCKRLAAYKSNQGRGKSVKETGASETMHTATITDVHTCTLVTLRLPLYSLLARFKAT